MTSTYKLSDFKLWQAEQADAGVIKAHYDAVITTNNSLSTSGGTSRYIDWTHPFPAEKVHDAIERQALLVIARAAQHTRGNPLNRSALYATIITSKQPDPEIWADVELPENALGFGKFAVNATLLGRGFGRAVAVPLLFSHARSAGFSLLYCDALPHLDGYYTSLGFASRGFSSFYSNYYQKKVTVNRYTIDLNT